MLFWMTITEHVQTGTAHPAVIAVKLTDPRRAHAFLDDDHTTPSNRNSAPFCHCSEPRTDPRRAHAFLDDDHRHTSTLQSQVEQGVAHDGHSLLPSHF